MDKRILVMGVSGMLGSMVYHYLKKQNIYEVFGTDVKSNDDNNVMQFIVEDKKAIADLLNKTNPDYIINCIGLINKYCNSGEMQSTRNAILVNSIFPFDLSEVSNDFNPKIKIIQIATDCVYDGKKGKYNEDDEHNSTDIYGKTKSLGEVNNNNFLNVRCSIIGPEIMNKVSLFEWVIGQEPGTKINGYTNHIWNGITTLQFAELCQEIIDNDIFQQLRSINHVIHYTPNESVSKYELVKIIASIFNPDIIIKKFEAGKSVDRSITSKYEILSNNMNLGYVSVLDSLKKYMQG